MLDKLRTRLAVAMLPSRLPAKAVEVNPFLVGSNRTANVPVYTDMTVRKATREGYKISVYVFRCVRTIVQAASAIPWIVEDGDGEPIKDHEVTRVMRSPNPQFSGQDMMELLIAHELLVGNALWMPVIVGRRLKEFWPVMPDLVRPVPSDVLGEWLKGWQVTGRGGDRELLPPDQFIHFMQMDPGNLFWGTSPLMAAARTIDTDNEAQDTQKVSMQNRATPDGVFTHDSIMDSEQFEEARRQIRENYLQKTKKREPWVLGAGAKWVQMSLTPVEMDFIASRISNKRDIAGAFGISPIFLGDLEQSSYDNMVQARKALYEDVVIPLLDDVKATLNLRIAPMYGNIVITYDISKVAALRPDYTAKVDQAKTLWAMGVPFDKINTKLEMGFEEFPGWDLGYLPFTLAPVGSSPAEDENSENSEKKLLNPATEEQKITHWKRVDRRRVAWWGVVDRKIKPLYGAEAKAVAKAIKGKSPASLVSAAGDAIDSGKPDWEKTITAVLTALIEDFGGIVADDLGVEKAEKWEFDPTSAAIRSWIVKYGARDVKTILATNLDDVKAVILAGVDENLTTPQIARNIRQFYTDRSPFKSMRIARTEVSHAAGFGQQEAARQSGLVKTRMWITSRDDRVRDEHVVMDGEQVAFNEQYSDGSAYPGEQDIMCRCVEAYGTR